MTLVHYHMGAIATREENLPYLLLAQLVEIVRPLVDRGEQDSNVGQSRSVLDARLTRPLKWLYELSNERRQTRHAVDKKGGVKLKPTLDDIEARDFPFNANALAQFVITSRLGLPCVYYGVED